MERMSSLEAGLGLDCEGWGVGFREGDRGLEKGSDMPKVTQQVGGRGKTRVEVSCIPRQCSIQ